MSKLTMPRRFYALALALLLAPVHMSGQTILTKVDSELPPSATLIQNAVTPNAPRIGAHMLVWDSAASNWDFWDGTVKIGAGDLDIGNVDLEIAGTAIAVNLGAANAQTLRVTLANDSPGVASLDTIDNLVIIEDALHASAQAGILPLAVRRDAPASSTATDGEYGTLTLDATGQLWVNPFGSTQVASKYLSVRLTDGSAFLDPGKDYRHDDPLTLSTTYGPMSVFRASAAAPTAVSLDDDAVFGWALRNGSQVVNLAAGSVLITGDAANGLDVDVTRLPALAAGTNNIGDVDVLTMPTVTTTGGAAHGSAASGNPHRAGFLSTSSLSARTPVATDSVTDVMAGVDGVQIVRPHTNLEDIVSGNASDATGASFQLIATGGVAIKQYLTSITCTNTSTTGVYVELKSGTTVKYTLPVPAAAASDVNGVTKDFQVPLPPNAANEAWNVDASAATSTAIICSAIGFKSKV